MFSFDLCSLGLLIFSYIVFKALYIVFLKFKPKTDLVLRYGKDSWAVITGASDGIGKGFAKRLADRGFNIVLIARNLEKLENVKKELLALNKTIKVKIVIADFNSSYEPQFFDKIEEEIKSLDVSILVNNVGVALIEHFSNTSIEKVKDIFTVNTVPQLMMTKIVIDNMRSRPKSAIINVSSMAGGHPLPFDTIYSSTKAFCDFFSRGLSGEYSKNIDIISLKPFYVSTKMVFNKEPGLFVITPEECAEGTFEDLGYLSTTYGHYKHQIQGFVWDLLPDFLILFALRFIGPLIAQDYESNIKKSKRDYIGSDLSIMDNIYNTSRIKNTKRKSKIFKRYTEKISQSCFLFSSVPSLHIQKLQK